MSADGKSVTCWSCGGHGVVSVYSAMDFEGAGECKDCGGNGVLWLYPSGVIARYKGGPLCGRLTKREMEQA